jgi:hypothetical protein
MFSKTDEYPVGAHRCFWGMQCLYHQERRVNWEVSWGGHGPPPLPLPSPIGHSAPFSLVHISTLTNLHFCLFYAAYFMVLSVERWYSVKLYGDRRMNWKDFENKQSWHARGMLLSLYSPGCTEENHKNANQNYELSELYFRSLSLRQSDRSGPSMALLWPSQIFYCLLTRIVFLQGPHFAVSLLTCVPFLYVRFTNLSWRWKRCIPPKSRKIFATLHGVTS